MVQRSQAGPPGLGGGLVLACSMQTAAILQWIIGTAHITFFFSSHQLSKATEPKSVHHHFLTQIYTLDRPCDQLCAKASGLPTKLSVLACIKQETTVLYNAVQYCTVQ